MNNSISQVLLTIISLILLSGCTSSQYITTFTPEQEPSRKLNMNYSGGRANIAVGDFLIKASRANQVIGDGLREMLQTGMFESQRFNVMDRLDTEGLINEQKLSYTKLVRPGAPKLGAQMDVAELLIYGTVTEFEAEASGAGLTAELPGTWGSAMVQTAKGSVQGKNAHMAIDIRVVDTASGRVVAARRIAGSAASYMAGVGVNIQSKITSGGTQHHIKTPLTLSMFKNTPMELAMRDCIYRSIIYATQAVPSHYFRH